MLQERIRANHEYVLLYIKQVCIRFYKKEPMPIMNR